MRLTNRDLETFKLISTMAILTTFKSGAPMRTRTSNPLIRSQILYPIELWVH